MSNKSKPVPRPAPETEPEISEENDAKLVDVINEFKKGFSATDGSSVVVNENDADALDPDDLEKESVKVRKPAPKKK